MIRRLCVIGAGLIGGSLAKDVKRLGVCAEVVGHSRRREHLERAVELGVIDRFEIDPGAALSGADMVVVAVPLGAMRAVFATMRGHLAADAVVTDVGSAKRSVIADAEFAFGSMPPWLIPGHPIAGTEHSGVEAALHGLFEGRRVILTPVAHSEPGALGKVRRMWEAVGAEVVLMAPDHHDEVLAATSHLPHMLAYTLVDVLGGMQDRVEIFRYAAGGFRDFTRIASSDPQMWHDICVANAEALAEVLMRFGCELDAMRSAVRRGDGEALKAVFLRAKALRDRYAHEHGA